MKRNYTKVVFSIILVFFVSCRDNREVSVGILKRAMTVFYQKTDQFAISGAKANLPFWLRFMDQKYSNRFYAYVPTARPTAMAHYRVDLVAVYEGNLEEIEQMRKTLESPLFQSILKPVAAFNGIFLSTDNKVLQAKSLALILEARGNAFLRLSAEDKSELLNTEAKSYKKEFALSSLASMVTAGGYFHLLRFASLHHSNATDLLFSGKYHRLAGKSKKRIFFGLRKASTENILQLLY
ncbi:MAG: hypothetical protein D6767_05660 [Candidatus Hydrogenedentota bacterium]|nr:MAG: hypothetical protein D6767_05660 [Candidatus Hydrogenedentota bacterium]